MFRTNNQVAFPWNKGLKESQGSQQRRAREACIDLFKNNKWDKQVRGLSWLIERFWEPLQEEDSNTDGDDRKWTKDDIAQLKQTEQKFSLASGVPSTEVTKGILYFTDNELPLKIARPVQQIIRDIAAQKNMPLVSSTRKPMANMGTNVVTDEPRGYLCMFKQILKGLQTLDTDVVFMAEHDVLYPTEHFNFTPIDPNTFYYDVNWWKVRDDGFAVSWEADQVSGLCAYRDILIQYYQWRIDTFDKENFDRKFEPFSGEKSAQWKASVPHIDIRHKKNLTYNKWGLHHFRNKDTAVNFRESTIDNIEGWDNNVLRNILN
jgi:hypothetical protein